MAFVVASRVKETSATTGTTTPIELAGAVAGDQTFVDGIGTTNSTYYCIESGAAWEIGIGTVTDASPDTLSRTTVLASSNSGNLITMAGTSTVFCTQPGEHAIVANPYDSLTVSNDDDTLVAGRKYLVDTSGGATTLTFPTAAIGNHGQSITVRKTTTDVNVVELSVSGVTVKLWAQGDFVECVSVVSGGGYAWKVFSHYFAPHVATMYRDARWPASGNTSNSYPGSLVEWTTNESFNLGLTTDISTDHDITVTRAGTYEVSYNGYSYDGGNSNWHIGNIEHTPSGGSADYSCSTSNYSSSQNSRSIPCSQVYDAGVGDTFALYHWGEACYITGPNVSGFENRGRIYYAHLTVREVR